jgi:hypothetical protein
MNTLSHPTPVLVRPGYREQDDWREALGPSVPLRAFATFSDSLDAPDVLPAGGMRSCNLTPSTLIVTFRG